MIITCPPDPHGEAVSLVFLVLFLFFLFYALAGESGDIPLQASWGKAFSDVIMTELNTAKRRSNQYPV